MQTAHGLVLTQTRSLAMTADLRRAIGMLKLSNVAVAAELEALAARNACLQVVRPAADPGLALFMDRVAETPSALTGRAPPVPVSSGAGLAEQTAVAPAAGLHEHLLRECRLMLRDPVDLEIAEALILAVEPSGWLGRPLEDIAQDCGHAVAQVEAVLSRVQQVDPAGIFARSLSECLALQAAERNILSPAFVVVLDNLALLAGGRLEELAALADVSEEEIAAILRAIRSLDPKPGTRFDGGAMPVSPPDLLVRRQRDAWTVTLNRSTLPEAFVSDLPEARAADRSAAAMLVRALERRNSTLLRVGQAVVQRQGAWLTGGAGHLVPMTMADLARDLDLHETTVGRAVADRMVATPRGTVLLRSLFSTGLEMPGGVAVSAATLRHRIGTLIAAEAAGHPLTDKAISERLQDEGLPLARRTVAKYREMLGIAPAAGRVAQGGRR